MDSLSHKDVIFSYFVKINQIFRNYSTFKIQFVEDIGKMRYDLENWLYAARWWNRLNAARCNLIISNLEWNHNEFHLIWFSYFPLCILWFMISIRIPFGFLFMSTKILCKGCCVDMWICVDMLSHGYLILVFDDLLAFFIFI